MSLPQVPREQRHIASAVAVGAFALLCVLGLVFGIRGLFAPTGEQAGDSTAVTATSGRAASARTNAPDATDKLTAQRAKKQPAATPAMPVKFSSPSGNIRCAISTEMARCDIGSRLWAPPAKPASCGLTWGQGLTVTASSTAPVCANGTMNGGPALRYGASVTQGAFRCASSKNGVTCQHSSTGHGFTVSRESYRVR